MSEKRPLPTRSVFWQLALVIAGVSLAFLAGTLLLRREDQHTQALVQASQAHSLAESLETVASLRGLTLKNYVGDYSLWGDMATYAANPDPKWAETNLDASLATFKMSYLWVYDRSGAFRYHTASEEPLEALPGAGSDVSKLFKGTAFVHYFVPLADGTLLEVRGALIQREDDLERTSEALGYFFGARRWDAAYVKEFDALTGGVASIAKGGGACSSPVEGDASIVVGHDLPGLDGPTARLCAVMPNPSADLLAAASRRTFAGAVAFAFVLFSALAMLLHVLVARPVRRIGEALSSGDASGLEQLRASSNEFGELARTVVAYQRGIEERDVLRAQVFQAGKMAALGVLGAGVAHELNNPLAAVLGYADMLVLAADEEALEADEVRIAASTILEQAERMRAIVDHIRDFSRAESGPPALVAQPLNAIVEAAVVFLRKHAENRGVALNLRLAADLPDVACDRVMLESVVQNLVLNASDELDFMPADKTGVIVVETAFDADRGEVVLRVTDNGRGIPENIRDKVFEPFFTTKGVGQGTGLGLSLVHGMAEQHGAKVSFDTSSAGTTFVLRLPPAPTEEGVVVRAA